MSKSDILITADVFNICDDFDTTSTNFRSRAWTEWRQQASERAWDSS